MRDLSNLLWCDLVDDAERIAFLESGRAVETEIIATVMVPEIVEVFRFRAKVQQVRAPKITLTLEHREFRNM